MESDAQALEMASDNYQLLDFGDGRKLERFGNLILDRPSPAALGHVRSRPSWNIADLKFELRANHQGRWWFNASRQKLVSQELVSKSLQAIDRQPINGKCVDDVSPPDWHPFESSDSFSWFCDLNFGRFQLKCTPFGHIGLFPEHFQLWERLATRARVDRATPFRVLSLFAYTGASSICFARSGAIVTHVEAARNVVQWARNNAELSSTGVAFPIRWLCEDAATYVRREVKRGYQYEGLILDPPTYGHGPKGQVWKIERDLPRLLDELSAVASQDLSFVLLTVHSSDYDVHGLRKLFRDHFLKNAKKLRGEIVADVNSIKSSDSMARMGPAKALDSGVKLVWVADEKFNG